MDTLSNPIPEIQKAKHAGLLSFSIHAMNRMLERGFQVEQIEEALNCTEVEILEHYSQVGRESPECLILGVDGEGKYLHVLVAYSCSEVVTTYEPKPPKWVTPRLRGKK